MYFFNQLLKGTTYSFDEYIENIAAVTKEDIVGVAKKVKLDIIYFLG
jgi:predicted Zn-dependent peptidase